MCFAEPCQSVSAVLFFVGLPASEAEQMANEPDNLVLIQLREIRATLAEHSALLAEHSALLAGQSHVMKERFDQVDKRFDEFHALTSHTLMLGTSNQLKSQEFERRYEFSEGEQRRMTERMDELERRLTKVEEKVDR
jgi:hypothetical protein